jgi:Chaperone of endosialidase
MPADDLVLNVRQIAGYPDAGGEAQPTDSLVIQRGGLGGPYLSIDAQDFVSTALMSGGAPIQVGVAAPPDAAGEQILTFSIASPLEALWFWNAYLDASTGHGARLAPGAAGALEFDPVTGWSFYFANPGATGDMLHDLWQTPFAVSPLGYVTVGNQILLGRDPVAPLEAATAQYVSTIDGATRDWIAELRCLSVTSFNMRFGDIMLNRDDIVCAGGAPIWDPYLQGKPRAPTPEPTSNSSRLATTAFVQQAVDNLINGGSFVASFNTRTGAIVLTQGDVSTALAEGGGTSTTPATGDNSNLIATTAFVFNELAASGFAPLESPNFSGYATSLTPPPGTNDAQIATTAFVQNAVQESTTGVASFNGRTGLVVLTGADLSAAGGALLASPTFTGTPSGPTAAPSTATAQLATTAFVMNELGGVTGGVETFNGRAGIVTLIAADITSAGGALLAGPTFTGVPAAPTAAPATSTTQIATTAFVMNAVQTSLGVTSFNGRTGAVTLLANDVSAAGGAVTQSPAFTGTPTAPTAAPATNNTQIATTAYVTAAIAVVNGQLGNFLPLAGGALTGNLTATTATFNVGGAGGQFQIASSSNVSGFPPFLINTPVSVPKWMGGASNGLLRWHLSLGTSVPETGANAGADFAIGRYDDGGNMLDTAFTIARSNGVTSFFSGGNAPTPVCIFGPGAVGASIELRLCRNPASPATRWITGWTGNAVSANTGPRWHVVLGNTTSETGGNVGSDFTIGRYNDSGTQIDNPITISRASGVCTFSQPIVNGSDARLKRDVHPIEDALAIVQKLKGVYFRQAADPTGRRQVGMIAQEVEKALPEVVFATGAEAHDASRLRVKEGDPMYGVAYASVVAVLVNAVKELTARVKTLEART